MTDTLNVELTVCNMRFLSFQLELQNFETQPAASAFTQTKHIAATLSIGMSGWKFERRKHRGRHLEGAILFSVSKNIVPIL